MKGGFFPDLISTLPLVLRPFIEVVTKKDSYEETLLGNIVLCFRLMKLMRVRKVSTVITNLQ